MKDHQETIIKLLGRIAFKRDDIEKIVTFKKGAKAQNYIRGYNACDGEHLVKDLAVIIGVTSGTLSPILRGWEEEGIIYAVEKPNGRFYKKLFPI